MNTILGISLIISAILVLLAVATIPFKLAYRFGRWLVVKLMKFYKWSLQRGWERFAKLIKWVAALIQIALDLAVGLAFAISVYLKAALDRLRKIIRRPT